MTSEKQTPKESYDIRTLHEVVGEDAGYINLTSYRTIKTQPADGSDGIAEEEVEMIASVEFDSIDDFTERTGIANH